jgi:hypothetical protein
MLTKYAKTITALVTGVIGWGYAVVDSGANNVTAREWLALAVVGAVSLGVYAVPNTEKAPDAKAAPKDDVPDL